jgi:Competence protein CoiA-like family
MASVHTADVLAAFQNGERALVFARHQKDHDSPLFHMNYDDATKAVKVLTREHLECFMPDCADRRLKAMHRSKKRDGFSHMPGAGGHTPESLFHQQSKALIASWVSQHWPAVRVDVELATETRDRIADVMLTWDDGTQVAVEIQYSAITVDAWRERHHSYRRQGIVDVWLFGHSGKHMRQVGPKFPLTAADVAGQIWLLPVHEAVARAKMPLLWINPVTGQIATAYETRTVGEPAHQITSLQTTVVSALPTFDVPVAEVQGTLAVDDLINCTLTPDGIFTPALHRLNENLERFTAAQNEYLLEQKQRLARRAAEQQASRARELAARAERAERERKNPGTVSPTRISKAGDTPTCPVCNGPLDPILAANLGRHISGCNPRW